MKWNPFSSVIPTKDLIVKEKIVKPEFCEDTINDLETALINAYHAKEEVNLTYYYNSKLYTIRCFIKSIDRITKKIVLSNNTTIYFNQIIKITLYS